MLITNLLFQLNFISKSFSIFSYNDREMAQLLKVRQLSAQPKITYYINMELLLLNIVAL